MATKKNEMVAIAKVCPHCYRVYSLEYSKCTDCDPPYVLTVLYMPKTEQEKRRRR